MKHLTYKEAREMIEKDCGPFHNENNPLTKQRINKIIETMKLNGYVIENEKFADD